MKILHKNLSFWILTAITLLAMFLRVFMITTAPKGALIDEAHFGYLAYSLIETGKDEHGISWPIVFKGFGDQKLPMNAYLLIPFVKLFGLNNFVIRIPSLIAGVLLVIAMYFLAKEMKLKENAALFTSFLIAISPWPFFLSRFGFESNVALIFFACGLITMLRAVKTSETKWFVATAALFSATWYSYIAYRPVTAGIAFFFFGFFVWQKQIEWKKAAIFFATLGLLSFVLFLPSVVSSNTARLKQVGIFTDKSVALEIDESRTFCSFTLPRLVCSVFWNKGTVISTVLVGRFFQTFSPQYLATMGEHGIDFLTVKNYGQFFFVLYPFFIVGLIFLFTKVKNFTFPLEARVLTILGVLISPWPTILVGDPQKVRLSALLPFVFIVVAIGFQVITEYFSNQKRKLFTAALVLFLCAHATYYFVNYFVLHTVKFNYTYQSYLPELFDVLRGLPPESTVYINPYFSDPIMFYAYYNKLDPARYQQKAVLGQLEDTGFQHTVEFENIKVKDDTLERISCFALKNGKPTYFVTNIRSPKTNAIKEIRSANGVDVYAFVFDALQYGQKFQPDCAWLK